jgi:ATP-dependent helicase/nuclease subunit B
MKFFNIPSNFNFLESLYRFLTEEFEDSMSISSAVIFTPSRRSANELKRIFIKRKRFVFLPTIKAIGDIDYDDIITNNLDLEVLKEVMDLAKPVSNIKHKLALIEGFLKNHGIFQSIKLADELSNFLNELEKNNCDVRALEDLVDDDFSAHWQNTLRFLNVFATEKNKFLGGNDAVSMNTHKIQIIKYYIKNFSKLERLKDPVIFVGNLMTIDNTVELIKSLKRFDDSYFIFKGFDCLLDDKQASNIDEMYLNYYFYNFIDKIKIKRDEIKNIEYEDAMASNERRTLFYSALPCQLTYLWKELDVNVPQNVELVECENIFEEMKAIAFYILDFIDKNSMQNIAVVSNVDYSHELEIYLRRYGLPVNNAFGKSLSGVKLSKLLFLINGMIITDFKKDVFLSFLKNDCVKFSENTDIIRDIEQLMFDNPVNAINLAGYYEEARRKNNNILCEFLENIEKIFSVLSKELTYPITKIIECLFEILEKTVLKLETDDSQRIIDFLTDFMEESDDFNTNISVEDFNILLKYFLSRQSYSENFSVYPTVNIIGTEEARLINYDLTVIFNCNDGYFPANISSDHWLNNSMRKKMGLLSKNCELGKAYYDFIQLLSQKQVLITRSLKVDDVVTFKSRFLQRLESLLKCKGLSLKKNEKIVDIVRFDNYTQKNCLPKITRPEPIFNMKNIDHISATSFNILTKNPYDFYAKYALKLKNTNALIGVNKNAIFGTFFHSVFESFSEKYDEYKEDMKKLVYEMLDDFFYNNKILRELYEKKTLLIADNFHLLDEESRKKATKVLTEKEYKYEFNKNSLVLTARADRIDVIENNLVNIVDYKTGVATEKKEILEGKELQMPYTAFILRKNGVNINNIEIWDIKSNKYRKIELDENNVKEVLNAVEVFIQKIINYFSKDDSRFFATTLNRFNDYRHLSRADEWLYND